MMFEQQDEQIGAGAERVVQWYLRQPVGGRILLATALFAVWAAIAWFEARDWLRFIGLWPFR